MTYSERLPDMPQSTKVLSVMASRIGESLKAARARLGWSRETLAHHSGVSWSAIAQIESGRRKDVRLSSLSALAHALGLSVDQLIGTPAMAPRLLEHRVLTYGSDHEYLAGAIPFLAEGIEQSDSLLVVATEARIGLLRDALGDRSAHVSFAVSAGWLLSPSAALNSFRVFVKEKLEGGAPWIRIWGEPIWEGRSDAEVLAWTRFESLLNLAFASSPVTIVCPYDTRSVPEEIVTDAHRTHPEVARGSEATASPLYREAEDFLLGPAAADHG
jgi:transcriptional regulator with XRE-family HTH domain